MLHAHFGRVNDVAQVVYNIDLEKSKRRVKGKCVDTNESDEGERFGRV